jgi:hypothetical protein
VCFMFRHEAKTFILIIKSTTIKLFIFYSTNTSVVHIPTERARVAQ